MCSRVIPTTYWNRDRFSFGIVDVNGAILADVNGAVILGITDTNPITTNWN